MMDNNKANRFLSSEKMYGSRILYVTGVIAVMLIMMVSILLSCEFKAPSETGETTDQNTNSQNVSENNDFLINYGVLVSYHGKGGDVTIPDSAISIGERAFADITTVTGVAVPGSVSSIGNEAFSGCSNLKKVSLSNGISEIGDRAFFGCPLEGVSIPASVTQIGESVFYANRDKKITVESGNVNYKDIDGVLFNGDATVLLCYPGDKDDTEYTIPDTVKCIDGNAFTSNKYVKKVIIPDSVTEIKGSAFSGCNALESVQLPSGITVIGRSTFAGCVSLAEIKISNSVQCIDQEAFSGCKALKSINIPDSVITIEKRSFHGCESLESITIPESVSSVGDYAFMYCLKLKNITIPDVVKTGDKVFYATLWERLKKEEFVIINGKLEEYNGVGGDIVIPEGVVGASQLVFAFCEVNSLTLPVSYQNPNSIDDIRLNNYYVAKGNPYLADIDGVLYSADLTELIAYPYGRSGGYVIPEGVKVIKHGAFLCRDNITSLTLPASLEKIECEAICYCEKLTEINAIQDGRIKAEGHIEYVPWENSGGFIIENGVLTAYKGIGGNIVIPEGVTAIADGVFKNVRTITSVKIPEGVVSIGKEAFYYSFFIENISLPQSIKIIGDGAFDHCTLKSLELPDSIESIGTRAFAENRVLTSVKIPAKLKAIPAEAFNGCMNLTSVQIPESVESIGENAFPPRTNLNYVKVSE